MNFLRKIVDSWEIVYFLSRNVGPEQLLREGREKVAEMQFSLKCKFHIKMHFLAKSAPMAGPSLKTFSRQWYLAHSGAGNDQNVLNVAIFFAFLPQNPESRLHVMKIPWNHQKPSRYAFFCVFRGVRTQGQPCRENSDSQTPQLMPWGGLRPPHSNVKSFFFLFTNLYSNFEIYLTLWWKIVPFASNFRHQFMFENFKFGACKHIRNFFFILLLIVFFFLQYL